MAYYKDVDVIEAIYDALRTPPLKGVLTDTMSLAVAMAERMPTAAVREVVYGKWRKVYPTYELNIIARNHEPCYVCSKCNAHVDVKTPFCPICGAVMREER